MVIHLPTVENMYSWALPDDSEQFIGISKKYKGRNDVKASGIAHIWVTWAL